MHSPIGSQRRSAVRLNSSARQSYESTFKPYRYQLTQQDFYSYSARMDAELKSLEQKIAQFVELCHHLREENQQLRQQLAAALDENRRLDEKISNATSRLENLLDQIPAEEP